MRISSASSPQRASYLKFGVFQSAISVVLMSAIQSCRRLRSKWVLPDSHPSPGAQYEAPGGCRRRDPGRCPQGDRDQASHQPSLHRFGPSLSFGFRKRFRVARCNVPSFATTRHSTDERPASACARPSQSFFMKTSMYSSRVSWRAFSFLRQPSARSPRGPALAHAGRPGRRAEESP